MSITPAFHGGKLTSAAPVGRALRHQRSMEPASLLPSVESLLYERKHCPPPIRRRVARAAGPHAISRAAGRRHRASFHRRLLELQGAGDLPLYRVWNGVVRLRHQIRLRHRLALLLGGQWIPTESRPASTTPTAWSAPKCCARDAEATSATCSRTARDPPECAIASTPVHWSWDPPTKPWIHRWVWWLVGG